MDVQNLEKNQRNKIIKELCDQGAELDELTDENIEDLED